MILSTLRTTALFLSLILFPLACGGGSPPAESPAPSSAASSGAAPTDSSSRPEGGQGAAASGAPASASETRTTEVIQKVILQNRDKVRACYEKALKDRKGLAGKMTIHFVLKPDGTVKSAEPVPDKSTLDAPEVVTCAIDVIRAIQFPQSSRGKETMVNYPFDFKP